ncbi:GrpB family protein [Allorhizocola rhizosphaerae]|uniref:GrpB family protein n=1 Tax=Allorhizocola rhizosphaerae TaxID=1872709 RepID=UPI003CCC608D
MAHDGTRGWRGRARPTWPVLVDVLPSELSIERIGSTSVPGPAAKPIIDAPAVGPEAEEIAADVSGLAAHLPCQTKRHAARSRPLTHRRRSRLPCAA